jgi:hypothetical protein
MGVFRNERRFWLDEPTDTSTVVGELTEHFERAGYGVHARRSGAAGWQVDVSRSGVFRTVFGLQTALRVRLARQQDALIARAGVAVLGRSALVPLLVLGPVVLTQVDDALAVVERSVARLKVASVRGPEALVGPAPGRPCACGAAYVPGTAFCTSCGRTNVS